MGTREVRCGNPECGALNRVPSYWVRRVPNCGKCGSKLPESKAIEIVRHVYSLPGAIWLVIPFVAFVVWSSTARTPDTSHSASSECTGHAQPRNGIYQWYGPMWGPDIARLTIKTAAGSNYFIKLEDQLDRPVRAYFVHGGSTVSVSVPVGTFTLKYASGSSWCNEHDLFGSHTSVNQADETFSFQRDETPDGYTSTTGWTVELIEQPHGNLHMHAIPRDRF